MLSSSISLCYNCSQGGLKDGAIVELANMSLATILEVNDTTVKLDANNMMAGECQGNVCGWGGVWMWS